MKAIFFLFTFLMIMGTFLYSRETKEFKSFLFSYKPISEAAGRVEGAIYTDASKSPEERAKDLISRMTFDKKVRLTGGWTGIKIVIVSASNCPWIGLKMQNLLFGDFSCDRNAVKRKGQRIVQLYISDPEGQVNDQSAKELKGFSKVELNPFESQQIDLKLSHDYFAFWDVKSNK